MHTSTAGVLLLAGFLACSGDQRSGAAPADTSQPSAVDTSITTIRDTAAAPMRDSAAAAKPEPTTRRSDTAKTVATKPAPPKPARPRPAAPVTPPRADTSTTGDTGQQAAPAQPGRTDTATAASQPAETTSAAPPAASQANAPLRDEYHRAPLDTVPQQVYDGWKQYNLNCARCHGEDVLGTTIAPHLIVSVKPEGPVNTKELFVQTVCAGRPAKGMPAWCPLGMEMPTIEAIYAYVKGRSDAKIHPGRPALKSGG
jgi:hypothetical protein